MTLFPSACIWGFRAPMDQALIQLAQSAFHYIDVEHDSLDESGALQAQQLGLKVSCVALDHRLPPDCSLDGNSASSQRKAVDHIKRVLERAQTLGARAAYLGPCSQRKYLPQFGAAVMELAEDAANRGIRLCIEHVPGRALDSAKETLAFVRALNCPNAYLLLDVGHTLLSNEIPWEIIASAGNSLGYVQLDDNDGKRDRHWPLLDGKLTPTVLARVLEGLASIGYEGTLGLELFPDRAGVVSGLSKNRNLLLRMQLPTEPKSVKEPETRRKQ